MAWVDGLDFYQCVESSYLAITFTMHAPFLEEYIQRPDLSSEGYAATVGQLPTEFLKESRKLAKNPTADVSAKFISSIVDREILPKLCCIHRERLKAAGHDPRYLAGLLLDDPAGFQVEVTRMALRGTPWPILSTEMLAPVARALGVMWEEDLCDFLDVTEAMGRLQSILRDAVGPQAGRGAGRPGCRILLALSPGETHSFGLCHVAGLLQDAGWRTAFVGGTLPDPLAALLEALEKGWYDVLGLSLACDVHSPALRQAMPAIRRASRNPALRVVIGGALVTRGGAEPGMWGTDACLTDPALLSPVESAV